MPQSDTPEREPREKMLIFAHKLLYPPFGGDADVVVLSAAQSCKDTVELAREIEALSGDPDPRDAEIAELRAQLVKWDELRKAVAQIIGCDPQMWPGHGNAPLAIASVVQIRELDLTALRAQLAPQSAMERASALVKELTHRWCTQDPCPPEELAALAASAITAAEATARAKEREACAQECRPKGIEAWTRDEIEASKLIEQRIRARE